MIAEYVWIDGQALQKKELKSNGLRSKTRTINVNKVIKLDQLPEWNYDGSSTYQADTENSEVILKPVSFFRDPFRGHNNIIVMCETYKWTDNTFSKLVPCSSNFRYWAK